MNNTRRMYINIVWIVLGAILIILSIADILDKSLYAGMGGGLVAVGAFQLYRSIKYSKDAKYREKVDIEVNDERNRYVRMRSWSWTGYIVVLSSAVGSVIAMIAGNELLQMYLLYMVCGVILIYFVTYIILNKKY